jgi:hypothetical protein
MRMNNRQRQRQRPTERRHDHKTQWALLSLLSCFAQASKTIQHPVRASHRFVPYQHEVEGLARSGEIPKFWIPPDYGASTKRHVERMLRRESSKSKAGRLRKLTANNNDDEEEKDVVVWSYLVDASEQSPDGYRRGVTAEQPLDKPQADRPNYSLLRRLFDQFVGYDSQLAGDGTVVDANETSDETIEFPSDNETKTTIEFNVTAEVNYTAIGNETANETLSVVHTYVENDPLQQTQYLPMRMRAILTESTETGAVLTNEQRNILFHDILSPALLAWSSALRVDPVVGNLTVDVNQLFDGQTCGPGLDSGLPSIKVPVEHLTTGIPDTDLLVYLSLGFVEKPVGNETGVSDNETAVEVIGGTTALADFENPEDGSIGDSSTARNITDLGNATASNTTTDASEATNTCSGDYLAAASFCSTDQYDRPTAALLHICIDEDFFDPSNRNRNVLTIMHELGHALGFNSLSMAHFRRPDGTPITPRVDGNIPDSNVECTGPSSERRWANVALPSEEILRFRTVRGGIRVAELVTPSVMQVVRNQFDCQNLTGAELESGESLPLSANADEYACIGDHWERRLFSSDLMNPIIDESTFTTRISTLMLAYFADSGWYQVDLSRAAVAAGWGRSAGCAFVDDPCILNGEVPPQNAPFFCNDIPSEQSRSVAEDIHACTPDLSRKAICSIGQYELDLPSEYQYFQRTYVGGSDPFMDYCPVYAGFANGLCSSLENEAIIKASPIERFGERNSRCLLGNLNSRKTALCLPIACVVDDRSLLIQVDGSWHLCEHSDQELFLNGIKILCPDPRRICPTFYCQFDCLGTGGVCDYESGKCMCVFEHDEHGTITTMQICGEQEEDEPDKNVGLFVRPTRPENNIHPQMPDPDSQLSDYYVPNIVSLEKSGDVTKVMRTWLLILSCCGCAMVSIAIAACWIIRRRSGDDMSVPPLWFRRENVGDDGVVVVGNRDKHKMIATVLVDMRIHDVGNQRQRQINGESLAETDCHLTESEASGARSESMSELSGPASETTSNADVTQDEISEDDIDSTNTSVESPMMVRRRRINEID